MTRYQKSMVLLVVLTTDILFCGTSLLAQDSRLEEIAYRSIANQAALTTFVCNFVYEVGLADTRENLIKGNFSTLQGNANGRWAKNGDDELFVVDVGDVFVMTPAADNRFNVPFVGGEKFLKDGNKIAAFTDVLTLAKVARREGLSESVITLSPWNSLGQLETGRTAVPGESLLSCAELPDSSANTITENDGIVTVISTIDQLRLLHVFSEKMNYLPIHCAGMDKGYEKHVETVDAIEVDGVGWFPKTLIAYSKQSGKEELLVCHRFAIKDFEYRKPSADELSFRTAAVYQLHGATVVPSENMAHIAEGVTLSPGILDELEDAMRAGETYGEAKVSGPVRSKSSNGFIFLNVVALGSLIAYAIVVKRKSARANR